MVSHTNTAIKPGVRRRCGLLEWPALLRKLDRADTHPNGAARRAPRNIMTAPYPTAALSGPRSAPRKPRHAIPAGAIDCHCHVFADQEQYPLVAAAQLHAAAVHAR